MPRAGRLLAASLIVLGAACQRFTIEPGGAGGSAGGGSCADGRRDGAESDVDCGGPSCSPCGGGKVCSTGADCQGGVCIGSHCTAPGCGDGVKNGDESDIDCGGACPPCVSGQVCGAGADCASAVCEAGSCRAPSCSDGVKNGHESDADCGGPACGGCLYGQLCAAGADCKKGGCAGGRCVPVPVPVWTRASDLPVPRYGAAMAYDLKRKRTVVSGGQGSSALLADTWEWDGKTWVERAKGTSPPARYFAAMAFDAVHQQSVLYGGYGSAGAVAETWTWDGKVWAMLAAPGPAPSWAHALAYDEARARTVLYQDGSTWEWDGAAWKLAAGPGASPLSRSYPAMAFDAARARTLLFGGASGTVALADTWAWDGTAWKKRSPTSAPPARWDAALVYDSRRDVVVLHGGVPALGAIELADTWLWDGTTWTEELSAVRPPAGHLDGMVWDEARKRGVLVVEEPVSGVSQTWEYHALGLPCAANADCGSGHCADGLCCDLPCTGACRACNTEASPGVCATVRSASDPDTCSGAMICDASGACVPEG